jgi:hypothetical protein
MTNTCYVLHYEFTSPVFRKLLTTFFVVTSRQITNLLENNSLSSRKHGNNFEKLFTGRNGFHELLQTDASLGWSYKTRHKYGKKP